MFRERAYKQATTEERRAKVEDPELTLKYSQFYMLAPQSHNIAEEAINAADHDEH